MKHSPGPWKAVKNSSWGEQHKSQFNDREGYVICIDRSELIAVASVIGMPFVEQAEIDGNANILAAALDLYRATKAANDMLKTCFPGFQYSEEAIAIEKAINKAEGL